MSEGASPNGAAARGKQLAANAIRSALSSPSLEAAEWSKIESFATGKAREYRSAQLKRTSSVATPSLDTAACPPQRRRLVKAPRRANSYPATNWPTPSRFSVSKKEFEEYKVFQKRGTGLPGWFMSDDQKALEIMQKYQE